MKNKIQLIIFSTLLISNLQAKEIYATFTVYAKQTANLSFNYSGIIDSINVDIMSAVKKNDILATLNNDDLIAIQNASRVVLKYAELDFQRHKRLLEKNLIDKALLDKFGLALESAEAKIELEQTILEKTNLRAPFDGVITKRMIEMGDMVSAQRLSTAYVIQSTRKRILVAEFDQKYHSDVKIGDVFIYHVDGDVNEYQGKVYRIYPAADINTRKIALQVGAMDLKVGLFGEGYIVTTDVIKQTVLNTESDSE